jgi:hypothetical protein
VGQDPLAREVLPGPAAFQAVLRKGLALAAEDRYASAAEFREAVFATLDLADAPLTLDATASAEPVTQELLPAPAAVQGSAPATVADIRRAARLIAAAVLAGAALIALALLLR